MRYVRSFGRFWWTFIVGDDWLLAAGVALAFGVTWLLDHRRLGVTWLLDHRRLDAWWFLPPAVVLVLGGSLRRATQR
jgi:hypothetical protein